MKPDLVLIDDDELVRSTWSWMAKKSGHQLLCLDKFESFDFTLSKDVPIYVDYLFSDKPKGTEYASQLLKAGFQKVYLTTGLPARSVNAPSGLRGIVDKSYPAA
jgi:hypothetical protein